jgi:hypothetical protein
MKLSLRGGIIRGPDGGAIVCAMTGAASCYESKIAVKKAYLE